MKAGSVAVTPAGCVVRIEQIDPPNAVNWPYHKWHIATVTFIDGRPYGYPNGSRGAYALEDLQEAG